MFKCGLCLVVSKPREKATHVVTETREATYNYIYDAHKYRDQEGKKVVRDDPGGSGFEIVKEVLACANCSVGVQEILQSH